MLRSVKGLQGYTVHATDGDIGHVEEFLFDDAHWAVRYLVVNTGGWLFGRQVLISPESLREADWPGTRLHVELTRQQVEDSPPLAADRPVTRQEEEAYRGHFGWPLYWGGGLWGAALYPVPLYAPAVAAALREGDDAMTPEEPAVRPEERPDPHLRSTDAVTGYRVQGEDGDIGHVEDFILDDHTWAVRYLSIDTGQWLPGRKVLLPPQWVKQVSAPEDLVFVPLPRQTIRHAPEWDPSQPVSREYEQALFDYYERPPYWR